MIEIVTCQNEIKPLSRYYLLLIWTLPTMHCPVEKQYYWMKEM
jgi:hypothetical protein